MCGADLTSDEWTALKSGSPPRVRSRLKLAVIKLAALRITSACAEQT